MRPDLHRLQFACGGDGAPIAPTAMRKFPKPALAMVDTMRSAARADPARSIASGWVLFAGIIALGASIGSGMYFHADSPEMPEEPGYFIDAPEEGAGEDAGPDLGTLLASADAAAGEAVFAKCTACHTIEQGAANGIGPNLYGVMGAAIGAHAPGFAYSSALSEHGGEWSWENMDDWLASPRAFALSLIHI